MWIGAGRITLNFYNNDNVALKRRKLEELCKDIRKKFSLSAMEVAEFDDPEECVMGFAIVQPESKSESQVKTWIQDIEKEIDSTAFARVTSADLEVFYHGPA